MPAMPEGDVSEGILRGIYKFKAAAGGYRRRSSSSAPVPFSTKP